MGEVALSVYFKYTECCRDGCGITFAMPAEFYDRMLRTHEMFHCPRGHGQHFTAESDVARLKRQLKQEQDWRARDVTNERKRREWAEEGERKAQAKTETEARRARAFKGHLNRTKKRVKNGVCPCCNRSFANLHRHMTTKHPGYDAD